MNPAPSAAKAKPLALLEASIVERLPWSRCIDDLTLATSDGALLQVLRLGGVTAETGPDDPDSWSAQLRRALLQSPGSPRLAIYQHSIRRRVPASPGGEPTDPVAKALGRAWKSRLAQRRMFATTVYLTVVLKPRRDAGGIGAALLRRKGAEGPRLTHDLQQLNTVRQGLEHALAPFDVRTLTADGRSEDEASEALSFLCGLVHEDLKGAVNPQGALAYTLADRRLTFGLDALELSRGKDRPPWFGALISLKDYPGHPIPGLLDDVLRLPHEMAVTECFSFVDGPVAAERAGFVLPGLGGPVRRGTSAPETLDTLGQRLGGGKAGTGAHHLTVLARAASLADLDRTVSDIQTAMTGAGAVGVREDLNLESGFWAQLPGGSAFEARKVSVSADHFASFTSLNNCWAGATSGQPWGEHVTLLDTASCAPFAFNFHTGGKGGFCLIGPPGAGKTVLTTFLLTQAQKFDPRIVYFDHDRGAEMFVRAMGGHYLSLKAGAPTGLNPLALPDSPANRAFLEAFLEQLFVASGEPLSPAEKRLIPQAVDYNYSRVDRRRRLSDMREAFLRYRKPGGAELGARLDPWCDDGPHAWLFDHAQDSLDLQARLIGIDVSVLVDHPILHGPAMAYLFHRVEMALDGRPAIVVADEAWSMRHEEAFALRLKAFGQALSAKNAILGVCFETSAESLDPQMSSILADQAATLMFLPNPRAREQDYVDGFGLSQHEFEQVRAMPGGPRAFLLKQGPASILARLDLDGLYKFLTVLSPGRSKLERMDQLRAVRGDAPAKWLPELVAGPAPR